MKKEKQVRSYKRRTKSGKIITVKAHTAKYEAADEKAKKSSKKEGAGKELEERKKKSTQLESFGKEKKVYEREENEPDFSFTADYYRYNSPSNTDTKSKRYKTDMARAISIDASALAEQEVNKKYGAKADHNSPAARKIYEKYYKKGHQILNELTGSKPEKPTEKTDRKKKVRPVGGGTVGPEPKKKSRDNLTPADKDSLSKARKGGYMPTKGKSLESGVSTTKKTTKTTPKSTTSEPAFTAAEFKEWYRGTGSAADKKVAKALRAQLGRAGYRKLEDEAIDNYTTRGHLSMFKRVGSGGQSSSDSKKSATRVASKSMDSKKVANKDNWRKTSDTPLRKKGDMAVGSMNVGKRSIDLEVRPTDKGYEVSMYDRKGNIGHLGNIHIKTLSDLSKQVKSEVAPKRKLTSKLMDSGEIDYGTVRVKSKKLKSQEV